MCGRDLVGEEPGARRCGAGGEGMGTHQAGLRQAAVFTDARLPETGGMTASYKTLLLSLLSFISTHKL